LEPLPRRNNYPLAGLTEVRPRPGANVLLVEFNMRPKLLLGVAAPALAALAFFSTTAPASAQYWGQRGYGWGAAGIAAGIIGGTIAAATSPLWAGGYDGYYTGPGYYGYGYAPGYAYAPSYGYGPGYAYAPNYGYSYGYATEPSYGYGQSYSYSEGYSPRYSYGRAYARAGRGVGMVTRHNHRGQS
jgi:hypothetical protein